MVYLKSIFAALGAGLGALELALTDDVVSTQEFVKIAIAVVAVAGVVWGVPNAGQDVEDVE
jgi:hypothetical protein